MVVRCRIRRIKLQVACKPGSVVIPKHHGCSFIYDAGYPTSPAAHPTVKRSEAPRWLPKELIPSVWPCSRWGLPGRLSHLSRRCALTAPFHPYLENHEGFTSKRTSQAVCFLLHLPGPCGRWTLSTIVFSGARTFLSAEFQRSEHPATCDIKSSFQIELCSVPFADFPGIP